MKEPKEESTFMSVMNFLMMLAMIFGAVMLGLAQQPII